MHVLKAYCIKLYVSPKNKLLKLLFRVCNDLSTIFLTEQVFEK